MNAWQEYKSLLRGTRNYGIALLLVAVFWWSLLYKFGNTELFLCVNSLRAPYADNLAIAFSALGNGWTFAVVIVIASFLRGWKSALVGVLVFAFSSLVINILKHFIFSGYSRPASSLKVQTVANEVLHYHNSFPSGHTTTGFAMAFFLAVCFRKSGLNFFLVFLGVGVGWSRMYLGQHWPADVLAGLVTGSVTAYLGMLFSVLMKLHKQL